ncbi:AAA family ATPase [Ralstonia pseudosolanacearum]|uniref:AAA family ATPase n=1 Tax=Ralstonia pseudosolanacearum TaxID=1310165 RepID=UPI0008D9EC2E|nr:ATP-binding protein [Ralstonia pseudosolanacearum]AZU57376.1 ATP-binding protein [Ralstonia solanacearum]MCD9230246.1 ATP-binding protein [Ralstonia pseudosolanacearum]MCK4140615.1 ATP-binding protein [Ralstonia pseudosolanacearum]MDO3529004.1 ATP-binding protein [Ralstonia pseudosolanacearum]MDO3534045.1 ATP-binding protein [Ralstonia pseudosolanacearum]
MARSDQVKALLRAYAGDNQEHFLAVAMQMAADEAHRGHTKLAAELRDLVDAAKSSKAAAIAPVRKAGQRPIPLARPKGELSELLTVQYPQEHLRHMVLSEVVRNKLERVLREQRNHERLRLHGLAPRRKLLLVGPPGTGKTMTAAAIAGELRLPLFTARFDSLITKFMGESASKLRLVFEALKSTRGVYFFDEFDSLGLQRGSQHDVAEMRRTLNMFLQLMEQDSSESLLIAATNHGKDLDAALFRRFDDVVKYESPDERQIEALLKNCLGAFASPDINFQRLAGAGKGESHADIVKACLDSLKDAVMDGQKMVSEAGVAQHLEERSLGHKIHS